MMGPSTNLNTFEQWKPGLPGRELASDPVGPPGPPISGETLGIALQSWATIGNEADLEFADFVDRYVGPTRHRCDRRVRRGIPRMAGH